MATIAEIRQKYPQYADLSDNDLATALHRKHYADIPFEDFSRRIGLIQQTVDEPAATSRQPPERVSVMEGLARGARGVADVAISSARSLVNQPAVTLGAGVESALNPNETYVEAKDRMRGEIEAGNTMIGDERLRTPEGQMIAAHLANAMRNPPNVGGGMGQAVAAGMDLVGRGAEWLRGISPAAGDAAQSIATLATLRAPRTVGGTRAARLTPEEVVARSAPQDSVGASASAANVSEATPDLRQAIVRAGRGGRTVSAEALSRHLEADTLPVPIRLTGGEATQNPALLSQERNLRGKHNEMSVRMDETNKRLGANLQSLRDQVGTEVFSTNPVEHGDTLIGAYRRLDDRAETAVNRAYHNLRQAAGGDIPVDARAVLDDATARMHKKLLFDHAPPEIMRTLNRLAESNSMTFENFESMRTNLARIMRSGADGNVKAAAGEIRTALESLPLRQGSEHLKTLADNARATARRRFQAMEADPAYAAAVNGTVTPDQFVQRFVLGGARDDVDLMLRNLESFPEVRQTVSVAAIDHLRDAARLDRNYAGNFSAPGFSRALQGLDAKSNILFDARTAETLGKLRNVAHYTTFQPRGSFVNNSNTLVAGAAKYGADAAEGMANFAAMGIPIGTIARRGIEAAGTRRTINRALRPGAGIEQRRGPAPAPVQQMIDAELARRWNGK